MTLIKNVLLIATVVVTIGVSPMAAAESRLGLITEVDVSGVFWPVLKSVMVTSVVPGSPAGAAGMEAGDYIVEANGRAIVGAPGREMAAQIGGVRPGERLRLKLRRGSKVADATPVGAP